MFQQYYTCFGISITSFFIFSLVNCFLSFNFCWWLLIDHLYGIFTKKNCTTVEFTTMLLIWHPFEFVKIKNNIFLCSVNMSNLFYMNFFGSTIQQRKSPHFFIIQSERCTYSVILLLCLNWRKNDWMVNSLLCTHEDWFRLLKIYNLTSSTSPALKLALD